MKTGEYRAIKELREIPLALGMILFMITVFDLGHQETGARTAKHLVRRARHDVAIRNRIRVNARDDKRVDVRDIGDEVRADFLRNVGERRVIKLEGIRAHTGPNELRTLALRDFTNFVHVETPRLLIRTIRNLLEILAGEADLPTMRKVTAVGNRNAHDFVAVLQERAINGAIRGGTGIRLNVHVFAAEELLTARNRKILDLVDILVSFVITRGRITLRILVRKSRTTRLEDVLYRVTFRRDHLESRSFKLRLLLDQIVNFWIGGLKMRITFYRHSFFLNRVKTL